MNFLKWSLSVALFVGAVTIAQANANDDLAEKLYAIKAVTALGVSYNDYSVRVQAAAIAKEKAERTEGVNPRLNMVALFYNLAYERWQLSNGFSSTALREKAEAMNVDDWKQATQWLARYEEEMSAINTAIKQRLIC